MGERPSEKRCRESFTRWLRERYPDVPSDWPYEPNGKNRIPDYVLTLRDREFAVEVTKVTFGSEITAWSSFKSVEHEIAGAARNAGVLRGRFILSYYPPVPNLSRLRQRIKRKVLDYMSAHADDETAVEEVILPVGRTRLQRRVAIRKMSLGGDALLCLPGRGACRDQALLANASDILRVALSRKRRLFDKANENRPRILVLDDGLYLPSTVPCGTCLQTLAGEGLLDSFAAVFLTLANETGEMLHESAGCFPPRQRA